MKIPHAEPLVHGDEQVWEYAAKHFFAAVKEARGPFQLSWAQLMFYMEKGRYRHSASVEEWEDWFADLKEAADVALAAELEAVARQREENVKRFA